MADVPIPVSIPVSIADVSQVSVGGTAAGALANTRELARLADDLGYHRYWVAEHHGDAAVVASCAPEVMIGHLAAVTRRLRVGSGAVLVNWMSPIRIVETYRVLESLHPGRIDLGLGRADSPIPFVDIALTLDRDAAAQREAAGADPLAAMTSWLEHEERINEILSWQGGFSPNHPFSSIVIPDAGSGPQPWLLGASVDSALLAARLGMRFCYGAFINPRDAVSALGMYRNTFRPNPTGGSEPHSMLAINLCCADTDPAADQMRASVELFHRRAAEGSARVPLADPVEAIAELGAVPPPTPPSSLTAGAWPLSFSGGPDRVHELVTSMVTTTGADEVIIQDLIAHHDNRLRSYELIADVFGLGETRCAAEWFALDNRPG